MKKILLSILMLCCMSVAWAEGTGDGSKDHPFTGEWEASEIGPKLEAGMYLAFDCVIKNGKITVTDERLRFKYGWVAVQWTSWSPGNLINAPEPGSKYYQYGQDNSPESRQKQTFRLTRVSPLAKTSTSFDFDGYFNGHYLEPDDKGFVYVASAAQFWNNLKDKQYAKIGLTQDIYLSDLDKDGETFCSTFSGTIDGCGYTIYGDHYGDISTQRRNRNYLFTYSDGATFKNLTFKHIRKNSEDHSNQAIITSKAMNHCVFENITFENCGTWTNYDNAGSAAGWAQNCTFTNITVKNSDFTVDQNQSGCVVGHAIGCTFTNIKVENCESTAAADEWPSEYDGKSGGVVGRSDNCIFDNVTILGSFIKTYRIYGGGVVGYSENTQITNCIVDDQSCVCVNGILHDAYAGGIVGYGKGNGKGCNISNCINSALIAADSGKAGGIVGGGDSINIAECLNTGMVIDIDMDDVKDGFYNKYKNKTDMTCVTKTYQGKEYVIRRYNADTSYHYCFGGIAGRLDHSNQDRCVNFGSVYGYSWIGGIAGYIEGGTITNCLSDFSGSGKINGICVFETYYNKTYESSTVEIISEVSVKNCLNMTTYKDYEPYNSDWRNFTVDKNYSLTTADDAYRVTKTTYNKVKYGEICLKLGAAWEQNIGTDEYEYPTPTGNKGVYHSRKISNQYGTACFPFAVKSDDKIKYYTFSDATEGNDIKLKFTYVEDVEPGTPVLFRSAEAKDANADELPVEICINNTGDSFTETPKTVSGSGIWKMQGTFSEMMPLNNFGGKNIYHVSGGVIKNATFPNIASYRAFFYGPSIETLTSNGARIRFVVEDEDGETNSIQLVELDGNENENYNENFGGKTFSLMGTEVGEGYRGIVIRNGKKYINK